MSVEFRCGDPAALVGYLYDECDDRERAAVEAHLAACASCSSELVALGATRTALASWTPPEAALAFRITSEQDADNVLRPSRWWQRPMPAWAQMAAAVVIFAAGAAIGMQRGSPAAGVLNGGAVTAGSVAARTAGADASTVSKADLAAFEQRIRAEMAAMKESSTVRAANEGRAEPSSDAAVVQRVRALLAESEQRQQRELALRLAQVIRDVDSQRTMDLSRIERTFGQMEGVTRPELAEQRQMINYLIQRTGLQRSPQ